MKLTIITVASLGLLLAAFALPARADWHYLIRTSGLGWSDGYHAYDQCPPRKPLHQHFVLPGYSKTGYGNTYAPPHEPYYFELNNKQQETEMLPAAPADNSAPAAPTPATAPNPQAQYKPRSRYFQALEQNSQQPLQARQPGYVRPY